MQIGIIGQGFVGNAIYQKFKKYYDILTYDIVPGKGNSTEDETMKCDVVFVCLPTPMTFEGDCYSGFVEEAIDKISSKQTCKTVVIKSTILPGTTERLNKQYRKDLQIVFNPEFLTEANAVQDFENQNRIILGGPRPATTQLKQIFSKVFPKAHIIKTGSTHAELVKYFTNCFLSTKVSFANEMYQLATALNVDYDKVVEYATLDSRLGDSHWAVPGPDGDFGFGGHCFPKDLAAIIKLCNTLDINPTVLNAVNKKNNEVRRDRDWEKMEGRAVV